MTVYHTLRGTRCTAVFAGPSGCGKSEIWRKMARLYPGLVRMIDFSRGLVLVLDEADKILCESAMGVGGTDYNRF